MSEKKSRTTGETWADLPKRIRGEIRAEIRWAMREAARVAAERSARERIYSCLFEQAEQRDMEIKAKGRVRRAEESIARNRNRIAEIKAEE